VSGPLLSVRDLSVAYGRRRRVEALGGVCLDVATGDRLAVIGESGSGKSTFALALAGLLPQDAKTSGTILWPALGHAPVAGRDIGFVFQDPSSSLDPVVTIGAQLVEVIRRHLRLGWQEAKIEAASLLARVRIPEPYAALKAYPHQLSGGQRQRVAIALAIAGRPRLLVADEATSALDTVVAAEIVALLSALVAEDGMTLLFITHDIALASALATRIAVFYAARMVEIGPAPRVLARPAHPYTAALIGAHLGLDAPAGDRLAAIPGSPPDPADPPSGCRFRPRCPLAVARCTADPPWGGAPDDGGLCVFAPEPPLR